MLENETILRLKRSLSDVDPLIPMGDLTPPASPEKKAHGIRGSRSFSWSKLTESIKAKGPSLRSSRGSSLDKRPTISTPILDPSNPLCPPTPIDFPESIATSPPALRISTAPSSPGLHRSDTDYAPSSPGTTSSPPFGPPDRASHPPLVTSFRSVGTSIDSPLERIAESEREHDHSLDALRLDNLEDWLGKMEPARLEPTRLVPPSGGTKSRAMQEAKQMEELVAERSKRAGDREPPPYEFHELIGKGAYGRVYKGKSREHGGLVAIKIIDIDNQDYQEMTTENLSQTIKEIDILQQLRDSRARPYVNIIEEARTVHNELWIVSEYASGGSINTLMKPTHMVKDPGPGLPEKFIIPIARELALGLKYVHEAGVLHRDLKTNNVLILEDGRVQLCDFGVSSTLEPQKSKRSTIVGTPAWMAPELQQEWVKDADPRNPLQPKEIQYGNEIDIWAYACTIHEMASGFPPHHRINQLELPNAGAPELEGDRFSQELKDFLAFIFQPNPADRPTPDMILEHPYIAGSTKLYPTFTLVKLVEEYYKWEQQGGARASLFNPYGAQAPDPLSFEDDEDDDNDWSFSTTEEFEQEHAPQFLDPFAAPGGYTGINIPPLEDMGRFEQLQARFKEESIVRGQKRLNKLFDTTTTPYRYSMADTEDESNGGPPSDLVLRDFNPGAPNRETVIDLDFSMPSIEEPSIDLGEVPTIRAGRMKSILREMAEEEERDAFNQEEELTKRATRDWKYPQSEETGDKRATMAWSFPSEQPNRKTMEWSFANEQPPPPQPKRETMEWTFAGAQPPKPNRRTVEWTFDAAMAENNYESPQKRTSRRRETREWKFPKAGERKTQDFSFPMRSPTGSQNDMQASSPTLGPGFQPSMRHAAAMTIEEEDDFPRVSNSPDSPLRASMIDLDMAMVDDYRPSTSGSDAPPHTASISNDNPFNLEDQVQLSQNNCRASYHFQSKSEPNQTVPGLLTPQQQDNQHPLGGHPPNQMHARGVSSASQVQSHPKQISSAPQHYNHKSGQRSQHNLWDGWSHTHAYGLGSDDQSPPMSVTTDTSLEDEDVDDLWDAFERATLAPQRRAYQYAPLRAARRTDSHATLDSDTEYPYSSDSDFPAEQQRKSRVSAGPNGVPLVDFPVPRGVDPSVLVQGHGEVDMAELLMKCCAELKEGTRAGRDLLRTMRLREVGGGEEDKAGDVGGEEDGGTVRLIGGGRSG
jgi:protein-serine/threonine kinase